jgi:hypothetical protein
MLVRIIKYFILVTLVIFTYEYVRSRLPQLGVDLPGPVKQIVELIGFGNRVATQALDGVLQSAKALELPAKELLKTTEQFTKSATDIAIKYAPPQEAKKLQDEANKLKDQATGVVGQAKQNVDSTARNLGLPKPPLF